MNQLTNSANITTTKLMGLVPFQFLSKSRKAMVTISRTSGSYFLEPNSTIRWTMTSIKNDIESVSVTPKAVTPKVLSAKQRKILELETEVKYLDEQILKLTNAKNAKASEILALRQSPDYKIKRLTPSDFYNGNFLSVDEQKCLYLTKTLDLMGNPIKSENVELLSISLDKKRFIYLHDGEVKRVTELFLITPE